MANYIKLYISECSGYVYPLHLFDYTNVNTLYQKSVYAELL